MGVELLMPDEAAERIKFCTKTLGILRRQGRIRYVAVTDRKFLYRPEDCDEYIQSRVRQEAAPLPTHRKGRGKKHGGVVVPIKGFSDRNRRTA